MLSLVEITHSNYTNHINKTYENQIPIMKTRLTSQPRQKAILGCQLLHQHSAIIPAKCIKKINQHNIINYFIKNKFVSPVTCSFHNTYTSRNALIELYTVLWMSLLI